MKSSVLAIVVVVLVVAAVIGLIETLGQRAASASVEAVPKEQPIVRAYNKTEYVYRDEMHQCDYVVINRSVFVWRGTNLLGVSNPQ